MSLVLPWPEVLYRLRILAESAGAIYFHVHVRQLWNWELQAGATHGWGGLIRKKWRSERKDDLTAAQTQGAYTHFFCKSWQPGPHPPLWPHSPKSTDLDPILTRPGIRLLFWCCFQRFFLAEWMPSVVKTLQTGSWTCICCARLLSTMP